MTSHGLTASSTAASVRALLNLTGFDYASDKNRPFDSSVEARGVVLDVSRSSEGIIAVKNKQSRLDELRPILAQAISSRSVLPCELPSFLGKTSVCRCSDMG